MHNRISFQRIELKGISKRSALRLGNIVTNLFFRHFIIGDKAYKKLNKPQFLQKDSYCLLSLKSKNICVWLPYQRVTIISKNICQSFLARVSFFFNFENEIITAVLCSLLNSAIIAFSPVVLLSQDVANYRGQVSYWLYVCNILDLFGSEMKNSFRKVCTKSESSTC